MYQSNQSGNGMINVPVILGPTAVGKTETTVKVAEFYDASVISCDSRQVYKYMDIGTAKPDPGLRERVPHYLIDVVTPDTEYSAYDFAGDAERIIRQRYREGKRTLICGGSGFYFSMLSKGGGPPFENSAQIKAEYKRRLKTQGEEALYQRLCKVDPEYAFAIS
ncbi:MAG: tRNA (adenosine(37)-N6)-dimethylallyltransferase, partial [Chitinivibrionales bacterium]